MKVIISGMAWLDRKELEPHQIKNIKDALTIFPRKTTMLGDEGPPPPIYLYDDRPDEGLIGVPRGYYKKKKSSEHEEIVRVSHGEPMQSMATTWSAMPDGPFAEQVAALANLEMNVEDQQWGGMILKAGCGFGKTAVGIEFARKLGRKTVILVHETFFLRQWKKAINKFLPGARVGFLQQDRCDYKDVDFTIAMIQSLSGDGWKKYPPEVLDAFGLLIGDEVHRVAAPTWSDVVCRFSAAWRIGLSATPRRLDATENVFFYHIGPIAYSATSEAQKPLLRKLYTNTVLRGIKRGQYEVPVGRLNSAQVATQLVADKFRTRDIVDQIIGAVEAKRKILVVSERLQQLKDLAEDLGQILFDKKLSFAPTIDFYTGQWFTGEMIKEKGRKPKPRMKTRTESDLERAERANVIFATKQMVAEGLDIQALDVLVFATPIGDIEQAVGRVRRWCEPEPEKCQHFCPWRAGECKGKPQPVILDVIDEKCPTLLPKWKRRKAFYKTLGAL